ncbi:MULTISPECIES: stage III sporulation protein AF [Bacillaceae]|uniref:Stage III sporulation protein AF n=1 Tax=Evansella alkalicola TaxID=745819 RepID=A0ABS6K264_9BACI|nr:MULTISPECIES: stage III sporulation protein AF [Bacillaceae]MBU9724169.1 stage III sporulation protein AF [Bacillus alkalicola]
MGLITAWVTNIILIILFATILELILPNSKIQRYVKLVVGLMLLMVMLQPILSIFQADPEDLLKEVSNWTDDSFDEEAAAMESKKMDIEKEYLAYISEQGAVQLREQASGELKEQFGVVLLDIMITFDSFSEDEHLLENLTQNLSDVYVVVQEEGEEAESEQESVGVVTIEPVKIEREAPNNDDDKKNNSNGEITSFLSGLWSIPEDKIHVDMKGGEE